MPQYTQVLLALSCRLALTFRFTLPNFLKSFCINRLLSLTVFFSKTLMYPEFLAFKVLFNKVVCRFKKLTTTNNDCLQQINVENLFVNGYYALILNVLEEQRFALSSGLCIYRVTRNSWKIFRKSVPDIRVLIS